MVTSRAYDAPASASSRSQAWLFCEADDGIEPAAVTKNGEYGPQSEAFLGSSWSPLFLVNLCPARR
jgi:hypothetical protein